MRKALPLLTLLLTTTVLSVVSAPARAADEPAPTAGTERNIRLRMWDSGRDLQQGAKAGMVLQDGRLVLSGPQSTTRYDGRTYDRAWWTSPWVEPGFSYQELIASWSATTKGDAWVVVSVRGKGAAGNKTSWDTLTHWKSGHLKGERRSHPGQSDDGTTVNVDTWRTGGLAAYQLRVELLRRTGTSVRPSLDLVAAMTSRIPENAGPTSRTGPANGTVLAVPRYSQMVHDGHYPAWGGGGEAWCSPTATSMVLAYYDKLPAPKRYAWVGDDHPAPWVDYAARATYDFAYDGTGNWPFNTAYAAPLAGKAFVTRLRSLREAEQLVRAGIPPIISIAFGSGELDGAPIGSSAGHLLVIAGFRENGDVVVNDPAASTAAGVRRVYRRGQLERVWLEASGGLTYIVRDAAHRLPAPAKHTNW